MHLHHALKVSILFLLSYCLYFAIFLTTFFLGEDFFTRSFLLTVAFILGLDFIVGTFFFIVMVFFVAIFSAPFSGAADFYGTTFLATFFLSHEEILCEPFSLTRELDSNARLIVRRKTPFWHSFPFCKFDWIHSLITFREDQICSLTSTIILRVDSL